MSPDFLHPPPPATSSTWRVDPSVLTWRSGNDLVVYHLRTGRSHQLPGLPTQVRELLERGGALEVCPSDESAFDGALASSTASSDGAGAARRTGYGNRVAPKPELNELLDILRREQLIRSGSAEGEPKRQRGQDLHILIPSERGDWGAGQPGHPEVPEVRPLFTSTVLRRAPRVVIDLTVGRAVVSTGNAQRIDGGPRALQLLHAFERPRTVQEVVRVLQGGIGEVRGWIGLVEALVRLYEGGVLLSVRQEERPVRSTSSAVSRE